MEYYEDTGEIDVEVKIDKITGILLQGTQTRKEYILFGYGQNLIYKPLGGIELLLNDVYRK